ncbi:sensor histidine kinase [Kribbella sp. NPDC054772]
MGSIESARGQFLVFAELTAFALGLGLAGQHSLLHGLDGYPVALRVADGVCGALGFVALWWRRRFPVVFAIFIAGIATFSTLAGGLAVIAVVTVAAHRSWRTALLIATVIAATTWPSTRLYPADGADWQLLWACVFYYGVSGWGMFMQARRQLVETLRERADRAEASREQHAGHARIAERHRIAREMHDVLAHRLSLLSVQAGAFEVAVGSTDTTSAELAQAAQAIRSTTHLALHELRGAVQVLRTDTDDSTAAPQPGAADLPALLAEASAATELQVAIDLDLSDLPEDTGRTLYRIVQEGLTNARKHAPLSTVNVELSGDPEAGVRLRLTSWLPTEPAPSTTPGSGSGLIGLRERAALAGGDLEVTVTADERFQLSAWLPWSR